MRRALVALILIVGLVTGVASAAVAPHGPPTSTGTGGAAATVETLATQAAIDTLKKGGNAVDAAVAAAGVLGVTEPLFCGIGGGGFMVIHTAKGKVETIDGRETGPEAMTPTYFINPATGQPLPFNDARWSGISVGVPGTPATWEEALKKYGTMKLKQVLQPGIDVAKNGFVIDQSFFDFVNGDVPWFDDIPATAAIYLDPDGTPHDVGTVQRNPDLAKTYELLAKKGMKAFYHGKLAQAIVSAADNPVVAPTADHVWRHGPTPRSGARSTGSAIRWNRSRTSAASSTRCATARAGAALIARDGRSLAITGHLDTATSRTPAGAAEDVAPIAAASSLDVGLGGFAAGFNDTNDQTRTDLTKAELIAFPVLALLLLFVFRGVIAASIPLLIGIISIVGTLLVLRIMSIFVDTSLFALNVATGLSLGLAVDYALLMVSRYREEIARDGATREAHRRTVQQRAARR